MMNNARNTMGMQSTMGSALAASSGSGRPEKWRVVTYRVPHNACVQLFDYRRKHSRIVFGPELVLLQPDEHFTQYVDVCTAR